MPKSSSALSHAGLSGLAAGLWPVAALAQTTAPASVESGDLLVNLILIGLALFVLLRFLSNRSKKNDPTQSMPPPPQYDHDDDHAPPLDPTPPGKPNMYANAQATWAALKSRPAAGAAPAAAPQGAAVASPDDEFLAGAKLAYSRIAVSLGTRDYDDLTHFVSPTLLSQLKNSLPTAPAGKPDILLVEASLAGRADDAGRTTMTVDYKVLLREPGASQNSERIERWTFARDNARPGANWLLEGMEQR
jgi:predicted lipid-binding transport protein (Tim44 family)